MDVALFRQGSPTSTGDVSSKPILPTSTTLSASATANQTANLPSNTITNQLGTAPANTVEAHSSQHPSISSGVIAGIVLAAVCVVALCTALCFYLHRRHLAKKPRSAQNDGLLGKRRETWRMLNPLPWKV